MKTVIKQRILPLLATAVVVGLAVVWFHETARSIARDKWLSLVIVVSWILATTQMLFGTPRWRLRSLALLVTFVGLVAFFGRFLINLWDLYDPGTWLDALYRGCFLVSAPLIALYSLRWPVDFVRRHIAGEEGS